MYIFAKFLFTEDLLYIVLLSSNKNFEPAYRIWLSKTVKKQLNPLSMIIKCRYTCFHYTTHIRTMVLHSGGLFMFPLERGGSLAQVSIKFLTFRKVVGPGNAVCRLAIVNTCEMHTELRISFKTKQNDKHLSLE
jgi:hypothetical protein